LTLGMKVASADELDEARCTSGRYKAAAAYASCQNKLMAKFFNGHPTSFDYGAGFSKCRVKYAAAWVKLQAQASGTGSFCDSARFVDNGDGTVIDRLTGLHWEQTTDDASVHDKDNEYTWSDTGDADLSDAGGTIFTSFLPVLNGGGCLGGQCDWRMPTVHELQTILSEPYPCTASPCVDQGAFRPSAAGYWSATTSFEYQDGAGVWWVLFTNGQTLTGIGNESLFFARAVRGTL
jgi:hypothetical protein